MQTNKNGLYWRRAAAVFLCAAVLGPLIGGTFTYLYLFGEQLVHGFPEYGALSLYPAEAIPAILFGALIWGAPPAAISALIVASVTLKRGTFSALIAAISAALSGFYSVLASEWLWISGGGIERVPVRLSLLVVSASVIAALSCRYLLFRWHVVPVGSIVLNDVVRNRIDEGKVNPP
jgi:hypothetical protein